MSIKTMFLIISNSYLVYVYIFLLTNNNNKKKNKYHEYVLFQCAK